MPLNYHYSSFLRIISTFHAGSRNRNSAIVIHELENYNDRFRCASIVFSNVRNHTSYRLLNSITIDMNVGQWNRTVNPPQGIYRIDYIGIEISWRLYRSWVTISKKWTGWNSCSSMISSTSHSLVHTLASAKKLFDPSWYSIMGGLPIPIAISFNGNLYLKKLHWLADRSLPQTRRILSMKTLCNAKLFR